MDSEAKTKTTRLKLFIDSKTKKVVFAEADKDFVDFICDILLMSMNSVIKLLIKGKGKGKDTNTGPGMVGTLGNVYKSVEALGEEHMHSNIKKDWVLKPTTKVCVPLLSVSDLPASSARLRLYVCGNHSHFTDVPNVVCPCGIYCMSMIMNYVAPSASASASVERMISEGYVKGVVKYMVMDNLEIKPLSASLVNSHIKKIASLSEKDVQLGPDEGVAILKASLESQDVLTTVFLGNLKTEK